MTHHIRLISATPISIEPVQSSFSAQWPEAKTFNLLDDSLLFDLRAAGEITPAINRRIEQLAVLSTDAGADGILFTCSAFGTAIEAARKNLNIPIFKPYEAMVTKALEIGGKIGLIATYQNTIDEMKVEIAQQAAQMKQTYSLVTQVAGGAIEALEAGNRERHDGLIADCSAEMADCDVLMLAQFSMAPAEPKIPQIAGRIVLTSPACAIEKFKALLEPITASAD